MKKPTYTTLYLYIVSVMIITLTVSNIIASKQMQLPFGLSAPCAILVIPITYVINDLVTEVYGFRKALKATLISFGCNLFATLMFMLACVLPAASVYTDDAAFNTILGNTPRLLFASAVSFLAGSLANNGLMHIMRKHDGESKVFWRCWLSTIVGEFCDKSFYQVLAFALVLPWGTVWRNVAICTCIAILYETICYPLLTHRIITWGKQLRAVEES